MVIGNIFKLKAGTFVWSIPLQNKISFTEDLYFIVTNTVYTNDYVYAYQIEPNMFGTLHHKNREIGICTEGLVSIELPKTIAGFLNTVYSGGGFGKLK